MSAPARRRRPHRRRGGRGRQGRAELDGERRALVQADGHQECVQRVRRPVGEQDLGKGVPVAGHRGDLVLVHANAGPRQCGWTRSSRLATHAVEMRGRELRSWVVVDANALRNQRELAR